jgi:biopolymer transport protein ExbB
VSPFVWICRHWELAFQYKYQIMKKLFAIVVLISISFLATDSFGQTRDSSSFPSSQNDSTALVQSGKTTDIGSEVLPADSNQEFSFHKKVKQTFIEGGALFMSIILLTFIFGLAIAIERIIYLNLSTVNTEKLLQKVEDAYTSGGVNAAMEVCRNTRGPVASIFYQGLDRLSEGIDVVEKSVIAYGSVQMGLLEKGLSWMSLFIAIAPMLGFLGTVIGMIQAFDAIQLAGDVSPQLVAGGIKVALITTLFGLIVAIILQLFYNYILSKIDAIVIKMEDASISLIDMLVEHGIKK